MKAIQKLTATLLILVTMTTLFISPASAADGADTPAAEPVFVMENNDLNSVDFSACIQDNTTIHTGNLVLFDESGNIRRYARFDEKQAGAAVFGTLDKEGVFNPKPLYVSAVDDTFCLRPQAESEKLYDDVGSFTFAVHDIFANSAQAEIRMTSPAITVTKADGELVKEMTLDFSPDASDAPMFLDRADLRKTLTFSVRFSSFLDVVELTLQPTAYDAETGVLTVSVRNAEGQEGCTLFDCGLTLDNYPLTIYLYRLQIPGGMFYSSQNERICSAENGSSGFLRSIEGMSVRICAELKIPSWITTLGDKMEERFHSVKAVAPIAAAYLLFQIPALVRVDLMCLRTLKDYGIPLASVNWFAVLFEAVKSIVG